MFMELALDFEAYVGSPISWTPGHIHGKVAVPPERGRGL